MVTSLCVEKTKTLYKRSVTKRSFKDFTTSSWITCLTNQDWSEIEHCESVDEMVKVFQENINEALDQIAPVKTFKVKSNHKFGLSDNTKELMRKRDRTRSRIQGAVGNEKGVLSKQYKVLRNKVTAQLRKESVEHNNRRIKEVTNEGELWKVANEVLNPRKENEWKIETEDGKLEINDTKVADAFNHVFISKVKTLKSNIDSSLKANPLIRLWERKNEEEQEHT